MVGRVPDLRRSGIICNERLGTCSIHQLCIMENHVERLSNINIRVDICSTTRVGRATPN